MSDDRLEEPEMILILEGLARHSSSATAQIQAIKLLREIRSGEVQVSDAFAALDGASRSAGRLKAV